jgi:hypothetical protein
MKGREISSSEIDGLLKSDDIAPLPPERLRGIEESVASDLKPVRPLAPESFYFATLAAIFIAVCLGSWRLMAGPKGWDVLSHAQRSLIFVPLLATAALLIFAVVRQMTPAAAYPRSAAIIGAGLFLWMLVFMLLMFPRPQESAFVHNALVCFRAGMLYAVPTGVVFAVLLGRGAVLAPGITGAVAGGLAGLIGLTVLEIHCPNLNLYHILAAHVSVVVVCMIFGFIFFNVTFSRWKSKV